ncbi:hypothetical protein RND81_12G128200 [Saponaria officinalis]|uniref:DUF7769 domain-containing protein n=1 Tax=Saponaria officinalis TaxID=3572 RepID=A0AAW1H9W3_SAPOF
MGATCLSEEGRHEVGVYLLQQSVNGKLARGVMTETAAKWSISRRTVGEIWKLASKPLLVGQKFDVKSKRIGNANRKRLLPDVKFIKKIDIKEKDTMYRLHIQIGVSVGTIHSWVKEGLLKAHSSPLHPKLNDVNKIQRMKHALQSLVIEQVEQETFDLNAIPTTEIKFKEMSHIIHMDENWFFITNDNHKYYLANGEELSYRSCQSKRYITKVMFMCAVSRPVYSPEGELLFDEKIGMFPFTKQQPAARRSRYRQRGTMETKAIESITKEVTKAWIIEKVIPAIKSKWPEGASKHILIQQDNAKPHIKNDDPEFMAAATSDGFNIELFFQPPNSPDLNTNDLGYFRALQSLQSAKKANNVDELVNSVMQVFNDYSPTKLNRIFLTLQSVMVEIMKAKGHNNFSIPHMGKAHLEAIGMLPRNLMVDEVLVRECVENLMEIRQTQGLEHLINQLGYNV